MKVSAKSRCTYRLLRQLGACHGVASQFKGKSIGKAWQECTAYHMRFVMRLLGRDDGPAWRWKSWKKIMFAEYVKGSSAAKGLAMSLVPVSDLIKKLNSHPKIKAL